MTPGANQSQAARKIETHIEVAISVLSENLVFTAAAFFRRTSKITRLPPSDVDFRKRPIGNSGAFFGYARNGRWLMGFKSPVRDRTLEEISIPNGKCESRSKR